MQSEWEVIKGLELEPLKVGSYAYLVDSKWWSRWRDYACHTPSTLPHPGRITNIQLLSAKQQTKIPLSSQQTEDTQNQTGFPNIPNNTHTLSNQNYTLNPLCIEGNDFKIVNDAVWSNLSKKYGHDVSLPRLVHADPFDSSSTKVDLRNVTVRVTFPAVGGRDETFDVETSRFKTLAELVDDVV
eukprot:CAMPEP_0182477128 /NCGR_PEP_ID=MMETSP1319-20130603/30384_1 /TAXON_ID=172717 /ORGANISM="Bolidomonas pacifica, Strain RCC208" /LENGTH=183 /DNA_ID=CAMNT_0024678297 /DNA_START=121 /DNA_END=668 /DNA_ORIENTATION=-